MADGGSGVTMPAQIAERLVVARQHNRVLESFPAPALPTSLAEAYRIQAAGIAMDGRSVRGWKVGGIGEPMSSRFGSNRLTGPIFTVVDASDGSVPVMPVLDGFAAGEGELALRFAPGAQEALASGDLPAMVDAVHLAIEIASSPFPGINDHGPAVTVADFGNNFGLVLGPPLPHDDWDALLNAPMTVTIGGHVAGTGHPAGVIDGPLNAVAFVLRHLSASADVDPTGLWISCGAVTGVHRIAAGQSVSAELMGRRVECRTVRHLRG